VRDGFKLSLVESVYDAALGHIDWAVPLEAISKLTNSDDTTLQMWRTNGNRPQIITNTNWYLPESALNAYALDVAEHDPRAQYVFERGGRVPHVFNDAAFISERDMNRHPYYDFLKQSCGVRYASITLLTGWNDTVMCMALQRSSGQGPGGSDTSTALARLRRHLGRAVEIMSLNETEAHSRRMAADLLEALDTPVFVVNLNLQVVERNHAAEELLRASNQLRIRSGRLAMRSSNDQAMLARLVGSCAARDPDVAHGGRATIVNHYDAFSIDVTRLGSADFSAADPLVAVTVRDVRQTSAATEQINLFALQHNLTPTERRLLNELVAGCDLRTFADCNDVTYSTARTHMRNLLRKVGVCSQVHLVAAALGGTSAPRD